MSTRVSKITAQTDEAAIRFAGLGFRSPKESNAWLVLKMPDHNCGLVVDIHMVMEHVWASIGSKDSITLLEKLLKLKIKTLADGLAMTSFDNQVPRFFSKATGHKVIRADESYFDAIPSFEEWDHPTTGFRTRLKDELIIFRNGHQTNIDIAFERGSVVYAIATMALVESIAWLEGFVVFLDEYHRDLTKAKFGTKKAWHVATRLGRRMMVEVFIPRNGLQNAFQPGKNEQICQRIFWAVLKSHDIMSRYKRNSYKDDPTVSSKLVKLMAINTGFDALNSLTKKFTTLEAEGIALKKEAQNASKAASTAANKVDEMKKVLDQLQKRLLKLETK
jgi:hypothetical protein